MDINTLTLFDGFYKGLLSESEKMDFGQKLEANADLRNEYNKYTVLIDGVNMHERERIKSILKTSSSDQVGRARHIEQAHRVSARRIYYAAAATLLLLLIPGYFVYQNLTFSSRIYSEYNIKDPGLPVVMGAISNSMFNNAMIEYKDAKYSNALAIFNQMLSKDSFNDTIQYYAGICNLEIDDAEKAIDLFKKVIELPNGAFYYSANYYLGLSYIKTKQIENAKDPLKIVSRSPHFLNGKASELLEEID
jgi:tetratricopeptide (TPR) repeat protein